MKNTMVMPYGLPDCILYMLRSAKSSQFIGRANANHSFGKRHEAISIRIANKITCNLYFSYYLVLMQKDCPPHEKTCLLDIMKFTLGPRARQQSSSKQQGNSSRQAAGGSKPEFHKCHWEQTVKPPDTGFLFFKINGPHLNEWTKMWQTNSKRLAN